MAEYDDEEGFGDFIFISSLSSHSINGPDFSTTKTIVNDDDDWGDFINSDNAISGGESLPVNHFHFDPFPNSSPPTQPDSDPIRAEPAKNGWAKLTGALPLSIFGEEDKEEESGAVDAGFNGVAGSFSFPKKDGNLKGKGSDLNELIADLHKKNEKEKEGNGFGSGLDVKKGVDLNPKVETWNWNGLNLGLNGSGFKVDALDLSGNAPALDKKEDTLGSNGDVFGMERKEGNLGSNSTGLDQNGLTFDLNGGTSDLIDDEEDDGWEFKGAESKAEAEAENLKIDQNEPMSNFNVPILSWDPLGTNANGLNSNVSGVISNASMLNSSLVDENEEFGDNGGWEFKTAESETVSGTGNAKVQGREQENPKGTEFGFGFGNGMNGSSMFFVTSGGISNNPGEWDLGFSFSPSFGSQSKQNDTKNGVISSPVDKNIEPDKMSWAFRDTISGNESKTKEERKDADASSGLEDYSFDSHIQGNEETVEKHKGALPLTIFGDAELETDDSLRYEDVSTHKPPSLRVDMKDTHSNISINDLISSLYSQAEKNASLNHISNPSEKGLLSSQTEVDSNLVNGDDDLDDDSWEFKGAVSGTTGENLNSPLGLGDSYEEYSTKMGLNDYVDFYSKLTAELCFVALSHLDNMKKDRSSAAPSGEDAEVKAIEKEIQGVCNELQKDGTISKEMTSENLQSRSIYLSELAKVLEEKKFQVLESEYHLSEKLSLAEKDLRSATELLKHAVSTLKILKLGSVEDQSNYVSLWSRILSVCALELKHGASIWKQSLQKNIHNQLLFKPQGRKYILALGEIFRVVKIVGSLSTKLYKPWILFSSEYPTSFFALVRECSTLWSSSGLDEALQSLSDPTDLKYDVEALLGSIQSTDDFDAHELYKKVFSGQEPTCYLSGVSAGTMPGMKMVVWDGQHYFLTIVNLWANLISRDPPNLPHIHVRK
ncbi:uncharacterized protein LOC111293818 isoform X2 [Durio zibethinus]|uniref:Uncharacterized protein LOC111293818 isoform X2 n=1 Tax=Durio zibethinus TaxID=66656 RepID=A0A6P5YQK7_DURZI|nr:uncharacterized protein LOC111293818 isoform X2 [Durio zibethinus]